LQSQNLNNSVSQESYPTSFTQAHVTLLHNCLAIIIFDPIVIKLLDLIKIRHFTSGLKTFFNPQPTHISTQFYHWRSFGYSEWLCSRRPPGM